VRATLSAPASSRASSSARRVVQTIASKAALTLLGAVTGVLIARSLQPESRGIYAAVAAVGTTAMVLGHLSVDRTQIYLWADPARHRALTANAMLLGLLSGTATVVIGLILAATGATPAASSLVSIVLLAVPFGIAIVNLNGIALLRAQIGVVNRGTVATGLTQCVPMLILTATGHLTVTSVIVCWAISVITPFALLLHTLRPLPRSADYRLARAQLQLGGRYHFGVIAADLLPKADVLLLSGLASASAVGVYTVAVTVLALTRIPAEAISQVALPKQAAGEVRDVADVTARAVRLNLLVSAAFVGLLMIASPALIPLVYGQAFAAAVAPLLALGPGVVASSLVRPLEQYLLRLGRPMATTAIGVGALVVNVLLNVALIPVWATVGAGTASSVSYILMVVIELSWFVRSGGVPIRSLVPGVADIRSMLLLIQPLLIRGRRRTRCIPGFRRTSSRR
jgi:O-antigen/teichoic acid export membrane protein